MWGNIRADATASALLLDRRALHRAKRAEHTAVTGIWAQQSPAIATFVEKLTGICGHGFLLGETAMRAGQHGLEDDGIHGCLICAKWGGLPVFVVALVSASGSALSGDIGDDGHLLG
jgi:hypothetical protein